MSSAQRTLTMALWVLVVASLLGVLAMQRWAAKRDTGAANVLASSELKLDVPAIVTDHREPLNIVAPSFTLTDQNGKSFDSSQLKGKIWTASLFFSECQGICPTMRKKLETLQAAATDPNVHFVSFSVDPERDTPEKLADYARAAKADPVRSHLLTGNLEEIHRVAREFLIPFDLAVNHSSKVMLVGPDGIVRSFYTGTDEDEMKRLAVDIRDLLEESK